MNTLRWLWLCSALVAGSLAQETVVKRKAHEVHIQNVREENGVSVTDKYIKLQPGINYWSDEEQEWLASSDQIQLASEGARLETSPLKIRFSSNHNDNNGALQMTLPNGQRIRIKTVGIAATDTATGDSLWLGEARDSNGLLDPSGNTVIFPDAFDSVKADIRVRVGIGSLENDVILRENILDVRAAGMAVETTRLEIWHQVLESPQPILKEQAIKRTGGWDRDVEMDFGEMFVGPGSAFLLGVNQVTLSTATGPLPVAKELFKDEASQVQYWIESVPLTEANAHLQLLPNRQEARVDNDALRKALQESRNPASKVRRKPTSLAFRTPQTAPATKERKVASIIRQKHPESPGFVMDYAVVSSGANYWFVPGTYLVSSAVTLSSTTTIEGGVVIKYNAYSGSAPVINITGAVVCNTSLYAPVTCTSKDDNSIGDIISGSTGSPSGTYGMYHFRFKDYAGTLNIHDVHTRYANVGLGFWNGSNPTLANVQALWCDRAVEASSNTLTIRNLLAQNATNVIVATNATVKAEHVTAHNGSRVFYHTGSTLALTNSLLVALSNTSSNVTEGFVSTVASDTGVFASVKAGSHYLAVDSPYRAIGTATVTADMAKILKETTTFSPVDLTSSFSQDTTLYPIVERGGTGSPDLGYRYPALDYLASPQSISGFGLNLKNGVCLGGYGATMMTLSAGTGAYLNSEGQPHHLNRLVSYNSVQEQPVKWITNYYTFFNSPANVTLRFTEISSPDGYLFADAGFSGQTSISDSLIRNLYWNAYNSASSEDGRSVTFHNNVVENSLFYFSQDPTAPFSISIRNNLIQGYTGFYLNHWGSSLGAFDVHDNYFNTGGVGVTELDPDDPPTYGGPMTTEGDYNAFSAGWLVFGTTGVTGVSADFATSTLGKYYFGSGLVSALADQGSTGASTIGLYHYTTRTSQTQEGSSTVDIGFHYIATDGNGNPADSDSDGTPDYLEDPDGDGAVSSGETDWQDASDLGLKVKITQPKANSVIP